MTRKSLCLFQDLMHMIVLHLEIKVDGVEVILTPHHAVLALARVFVLSFDQDNLLSQEVYK